MVETKVPKDIRVYKTKIIGPFSLRQLICLVLAVLLDGLIYFALSAMEIELDINTIIYGVIFIDLPILAFMIEIDGLPMEKYLKEILIKQFLLKQKRSAETHISSKKKPVPMTKKERKNYESKQKSIQRKHPELKAFK